MLVMLWFSFEMYRRANILFNTLNGGKVNEDAVNFIIIIIVIPIIIMSSIRGTLYAYDRLL